MSTETLTKSEVEFTDYELDQINAEFAKLKPLERIELARAMFGKDLIASTAFGPTSPLMLELISKVDHNIQVVNIRLGHENNKTKILADLYKWAFKLNLSIHGDDSPISDDIEVLRGRKKHLFQQEVVNRYQPKAVLFGAMQWQTEARESMRFVERRGSFLAINPVLDQREEDVDRCFVRTGLPINIDYLDPTKGLDQKKECGLLETHFN